MLIFSGENLSGDEYNLMDTSVMCTKRGDIQVKGKGIMTTYFVQLTEDTNVVEKSVYDEDYNNDRVIVTEHHVEVIDQEGDNMELTAHGYDKIDVKKDSGFGSQGHIEVDKIRLKSRSQEKDELKEEVKYIDDEEVFNNDRKVLGKLSKQQLKDHYDKYECSDNDDDVI